MRLIMILTLVIAVLALACGDGDNEGPTATSTAAGATATVEQPTEPAQASPSPNAEAAHTGIAELDPVIDALRSQDVERLRPLVKFSQSPRASSGMGVALCRAGEPEGTVVESFVVGGCEGEFLRPDEMDRISGSLTPYDLYAVFRVAPGSLGNDAEYAAITSTYTESAVSYSTKVFWIASGGIIGVGDCPPAPPAQFATELGLTDALLPPQTQ